MLPKEVICFLCCGVTWEYGCRPKALQPAAQRLAGPVTPCGPHCWRSAPAAADKPQEQMPGKMQEPQAKRARLLGPNEVTRLALRGLGCGVRSHHDLQPLLSAFEVHGPAMRSQRIPDFPTGCSLCPPKYITQAHYEDWKYCQSASENTTESQSARHIP